MLVVFVSFRPDIVRDCWVVEFETCPSLEMPKDQDHDQGMTDSLERCAIIA